MIYGFLYRSSYSIRVGLYLLFILKSFVRLPVVRAETRMPLLAGIQLSWAYSRI